MSTNFGSSFTVRTYSWTNWKTARSSRRGRHQYEDNGITYMIWFYDGPEIHLCTIWKGTVPDGVIAGGYSQSQNDTDKTDFENNFQSKANKALGQTQLVSYTVETALAGANNKSMISIFNPSGSGKILKLREVWATVPSSSGATVIIPFELRHATAVTTGTLVTPKPLSPSDAASVAEVRSAPSGITDHATDPLWWTWLQQINTAQSSTDAMTHELHDGRFDSELKPITLEPGNGCYAKQVANNTSTFRMGFLFTEEDE